MQLITDLHNRVWEFAPPYPKLASLEITTGLTSEDHLTKEEKAKLQQLVNDHFGKQTETLGRAIGVEHVIDTGDALPIKQRYYPMSPARLKLVYDELDKMLAMGIVAPSKSAWASPIVLVDKPDGTKRFCVNYKKLNEVTKRDAYPLPHVTTILDRLRDARYLSSLDIKSAYWQIPLSVDSREKTGFVVPGRGLFEFLTMPFGLHNAPATWQRFIDSVIRADLEPHVFVYLDDIVVITDTFERHLEVLKEIFCRLRLANVTLNKEKCHLCRQELRYLGYVVDQRGLRVDPEKVDAIIKIPRPNNQKSVRQFCGTASWYRRFIPDFASRLYPLTKMLKKNQRFEWTKEAEDAFEDIRSCLVRAPILTCPDFARPFIISCDASGVGIGAVLSQNSDQGEQVIAYASRTLTKAEQKYSATERECLAVIWAVERFRPYIEGTHFTVITDHYSLLWLFRLKDPQGRLARWALRLQPYSFDLIHRKGKEHVVPDLLSRSTLRQEEENIPILAEVTTYQDDQEEVEDKWHQKMLREVKSNEEKYPAWKVEEGTLWKRIPHKQTRLDGTSAWKKVLPKQERTKIISEFHDAATAGHLGTAKTFARVQNLYYWPKMRSDVGKYVSRCRICQQSKGEQTKPSGMMGSRRAVDQPWTMVAADLLGPFPRSTSGFKYILVVVDTFTKFCLLFPLRAATASLVAQHLERDVFLLWGIPRYLICDNGPEFIGKAVKDLAKEYKIKILYNASRHPQANPAERVNKTIGNMLRAYVGDNHRHWDKQLPKLGFALRTAKHDITGYTPNYLNYGRELHLNLDEEEVDGSAPEVNVDNSNYGQKLRKLKDIYSEVQEKLDRSYQKNASRYNLRRRHQEFRENDLVWKKNYQLSDAVRNFSAKLAPKFIGPFKISKRKSPLIYELQDEAGKNAGTWHVEDLKPYA